MRIWVIETEEPLPLEREARLLRYGAWTRYWAKKGVEVLWWAPTFSHSKRRHLFEQNHEASVGGVRFKLLHGPAYRKSVSYQRRFHEKQVVRRFLESASKEAVPDILLASVPSLGMAEAAVNWGSRNEVPVALDIRGAWPRAFVDSFPWGTRTGARFIFRSQFSKLRRACHGAAAILGQGEALVDYGVEHAGRPRGIWDRAFPFGFDDGEPTREEEAASLRFWTEQKVDFSALTVCFFGVIGREFPWAAVVNAASQLDGVQFVVCGDGSGLERLRAKSASLSNVFLPGWVSRAQVTGLLKLSDLGFAPYGNEGSSVVVQKPIEFLAAGLGVVTSDRAFGTLLETNRCGMRYRPDDPGHLISVLKWLSQEKETLQSWSRSARALFERQFSVPQVAEEVLQHLDTISTEKRCGTVNPLSQENHAHVQ